MNSRCLRFFLPLAFFGLSVFQGRSQDSVSDWSSWVNYGQQEETGFGISASVGDPVVYTDYSIGQTFQITDGNALVSTISFPIFNNYSSVEFQAGVAVWNGTQATGSALYLSSALSAANSDSWQYFSVTPSGLTLTQNQEYLLFLTPVNSSPPFDAGVGLVPVSDYPAQQNYQALGQLDPNDLSTPSWNPNSDDMAFEIDYQVVPEPGIFALLCLGSLALWLRNRI
jgi:hypothetical protein